ncbi:MAG: hypothetical protein KAQ64_02175 [Candidatus Pacebacteria bacterium]|nr:hypothetical protein [Candidatus Paceibacterota bacterium]
MSSSDNIIFFSFLAVVIFAFFIFPQIDDLGEKEREGWDPFFEGNYFSEEVIFPNGEEGRVFLGCYGTKVFRIVRERDDDGCVTNSSSPRFETVGTTKRKELFLFLNENLEISYPENSSWKVLVFPDEEKFIVYQR